MKAITSLLGRTLVLVAHPDDEAIGCGVLLQRMQRPMIVFATDGAPRDKRFWNGPCSREAYALDRKREAMQAVRIIGVQHIEFLGDYGPDVFVDQELFRHLREALEVLVRIVQVVRPGALLTHAYEGGHPDHDACSFLGHTLGRRFGIPVWEMPLYYRMQEPKAIQQFLTAGQAEVGLDASPDEIDKKSLMVQSYVSQREFLRIFELDRERFRPQAAYDYSRPPHEGVLNYEAWKWPMSGKDLCSAFMQLQPARVPPRAQRAARQDGRGYRAGA